ncbi:ABC transporter ATP-binding protein [Baaleninema sp.]|uniref:ABC transporter ATP-binding protein n=1 Tax=Baaleninema sp. TaxID=3101197 RepID=UPI003D07EADA
MIEVEHLSKSYGSLHAIRDLSFSVEDGEILGFLGPNGAGKTTTMRILTGFLPATSGTARIAGFDVHDQSMKVRQRIGYLPENPPLYPEMTVEGFLHFVARIKGVSAGDRTPRVNIAISRCGLTEYRKTLIRKLSKGYRQRVGIAQAIVHDPPVIVLDEPTVGLDPRQIIEVRNLIKSLAGDHTIILSTHILPEVSMTCSQVAIINRGRLVTTDTLENLMGQLTGGTTYDIEVGGEVDGVEAAIQSYLGNLPEVKSVESLSNDELPDYRFRFRVKAEAGCEPGSDIAAAVLEGNLKLFEMRRTRASLEEIFLQLTTEEKSEETPVSETESSEAESSEVESSEVESDTSETIAAVAVASATVSNTESSESQSPKIDISEPTEESDDVGDSAEDSGGDSDGDGDG